MRCFKKYPHLFDDDDVVSLTEKIHGTYMQVGWCADLAPREDLFGDGRVWVTSKGIAGKGMYIKNVPENADNLYVKTALAHNLTETLIIIGKVLGAGRIYAMGEVAGDVQDLKYGCKPGHYFFRLFDVYIDKGDGGKFFGLDSLHRVARDLGVEVVPTIVEGVWADIRPKLMDYTRGKSLLAPNQIREGVVIKTVTEQRHPRFGRKIAKSVSEDYLLRKGETTELQ